MKNRPTQKGKFIVVEGGDGAGKSTQLKILKSSLDPNKFIFTREPGGTPFAEVLRSLVLKSEHSASLDAVTQMLTVFAARADHMQKVIIPALDAGINVVCDRFDMSTWNYQIYGSEALHLKELFWKIRKDVLGDYVPDIYVFLTIEPSVALLRKNQQSKEDKNTFDDKSVEYHNRTKTGSIDFLEYVNHKIIDGGKSIEEVQSNFRRVIDEVLGH